ncbi:collagen alpha-2(V) chain-like isoform X2 [Canis lupus dingo]|nr:collagen alpha-2(V) chain-like isoform X2 [Canis lupus dingo]
MHWLVRILQTPRRRPHGPAPRTARCSLPVCTHLLVPGEQYLGYASARAFTEKCSLFICGSRVTRCSVFYWAKSGRSVCWVVEALSTPGHPPPPGGERCTPKPLDPRALATQPGQGGGGQRGQHPSQPACLLAQRKQGEAEALGWKSGPAWCLLWGFGGDPTYDIGEHHPAEARGFSGPDGQRLRKSRVPPPLLPTVAGGGERGGAGGEAQEPGKCCNPCSRLASAPASCLSAFFRQPLHPNWPLVPQGHPEPPPRLAALPGTRWVEKYPRPGPYLSWPPALWPLPRREPGMAPLGPPGTGTRSWAGEEQGPGPSPPASPATPRQVRGGRGVGRRLAHTSQPSLPGPWAPSSSERGLPPGSRSAAWISGRPTAGRG